MRSSVLKKNVHLDWVLLHVRHPTKHVIGINNTYSLKGPFDLDVIAILFGNSKSREVNWLDQGSGDGLCSQEFDPSSLQCVMLLLKSHSFMLAMLHLYGYTASFSGCKAFSLWRLLPCSTGSRCTDFGGGGTWAQWSWSQALERGFSSCCSRA